MTNTIDSWNPPEIKNTGSKTIAFQVHDGITRAGTIAPGMLKSGINLRR